MLSPNEKKTVANWFLFKSQIRSSNHIELSNPTQFLLTNQMQTSGTSISLPRQTKVRTSSFVHNMFHTSESV